MANDVEDEFNRISEYLGKTIEVAVTSAICSEIYHCRLNNIEDYRWVIILLGEDKSAKAEMQIPFIGAGSGIIRVRDEAGKVLYENPGLSFPYEKADFFPSFDQEDNALLNGLRMAKFGPGHDLALQDPGSSLETFIKHVKEIRVNYS